MKSMGWPLARRALWGAGVLLALSGCALQPPIAPTVNYAVGRAQVVLPAGAWADLGAGDEAWAPMPVAAARVALRSRALVLRGPQRQTLAVLLVRTNASNLFWKPVAWGVGCPRELDVLMRDEASGSPYRLDCLRLRRNADAQQWLQRTRPETQAWLVRNHLLPGLTYSHLSYRFATEDGGFVELQIVADQRLLQSEAGSQVRQQRNWVLAVASAARDSLSSLGGELILPAFPGAH